MKKDPYNFRRRAFEGESLGPYETCRAIYHLAQRRHFRGREIDEVSVDSDQLANDEVDLKAASARANTTRILKREGKTLGAWLADRGPHEKKRGEQATREIVEEEFDRIWLPLVTEPSWDVVRDTIFYQRPIFWRLKNPRGMSDDSRRGSLSKRVLAVAAKADARKSEQSLSRRRNPAAPE